MAEPADLSVLNPHPTLLAGPDLLHRLIGGPSDDSIALDYLGRNKRLSLSYRHLHDAADALASRICRAVGQVQDRFVVPVLVHQSPQLYIALLAILKAGGAFCPINVDAPPDRVGFILGDVAATVVVVAKELASNVPLHSAVNVLIVDQEEEGPYLEVDSVSRRAPGTKDLAYVMYTSGSTGVPKGVGISHSAVTQALLAHDQHVPGFSRFLQFAAPTFDVSVFEIFFPLFRGSTLVSVDRKEMLNDLPAVISEMNVDACELTPTVAASLLRTRENVPTLRLLLTIGEMLNEPVIREFGGNEDRKSLLWAMYGPTEATIHCTVQEEFISTSSIKNIGIPLSTVSCFIVEPVDMSGTVKILPRGEVGELAVGGHQLADGYLNRQEQTASSFISSPYGRIYRTGDRARIASDGTIEIFGRLSEGQVKLRGQRLELGEVQSAVLKTPGCLLAVAAVVDSILIVFCVVDAGVTQDSIMEHCRSWLPQFMMPGELVLMDEFPRLPSGKVDTKKLKADFAEQRAAATTLVGLSDAEQAVMSIVSTTLGDEISPGMTLASAGVDSLVAIKLASSLRSAGYEAVVAELLSMQTIAQLCSRLWPLPRPSDGESDVVDIHLMDSLSSITESNTSVQESLEFVEDVLLCSVLQEAMLSETAQRPEAYWNEIELQVNSGITAAAIEDAIYLLARQRDVLRSGFAVWQGSFVSLIFKDLRPGQVQIVEEFYQPDLFREEALLRPLRIQIQPARSEYGSRVLIYIHHTIYDGWSMDIILSDLSDLLCSKVLSYRPQFSSLLKYMRNIPRSQLDSARSFWAEYLLDINKPSRPKLSSGLVEVDEITSVKEQLNVAGNAFLKTGYGAQVYFQAALAIIWGSVAGTSDVLLGSVTSGRTIPVENIEAIVGPSIASLPLRVKMDPSTTIPDILRNINESNHKIMEHCILSLSEIKKLSRLQATESIYDVLFIYQESLFTKNRKEAVIKETRHLDRLETELLLEAEPNDSGFSIQATHHTGVFPPDVVQTLIKQFKAVVQHLMQHPDGLISELKEAIGTEPSVANTGPEKLQEQADLASLFEAAAAKTPNADAICFSRTLSDIPLSAETLSYESLNQLSNQTARFLLEQGAEPGQVIAIVMQKSPLLYVSILGIAKARCAYLPLLPSTPIKRVREIFKSGGIRHCVVDEESLSKFHDVADIQYLNVESAPLQAFPTHNLEIEPDSSRLAYVIYTSGTTGVPKGVAVSHKNIVSNVTYLASIYPAAQRNSSRLLQACSQAFDVSVFEIFFAWYAGMCLCAAANDDLFEDLEHSIRQFHITHLSLTPTVASLIDPKNVPDVEFLVTAGEPMTQSVLDTWGELLWQGYGPSETTNICSVKRMKRGEYIEHLGWCFPNTSVFVLHPNSLSTVPIGWIGEFCFGGEQVADGYLNMPDLTARKFVKHPEYGLIYRSGDMGRMLPDKSLIILGRIDDQLKLRGQRIEASEVNSVVTLNSSVHAAVTLILKRETGAADQLVSFYIVSHRTSDETCEALEPDTETHRSVFSSLLSRLPSYMVPSCIIPISRIPLTSSGKVDRRRLHFCFNGLAQEYLESVSSTMVAQDDAEWSKMENMIADIISQSLGVSRFDIGRWTPFVTLGLDSISAISVSRTFNYQLELDCRVPISAILQNPSVAQLARFLEERPKTDHSTKQERFFSESFVEQVHESFRQEPYSIAEVLPCSPLQEAMLAQGQGSYYNRTLLRLNGLVDDMRGYWDEMTRRHSILRTCFITTDNVKFPIAQVVLGNWAIQWKQFRTDESSLDGAVQQHLAGLPNPLDTKVPPSSFAVIQQQQSTYLSFICHHALYDGTAMENLWREVESLAQGKTLPPAVPYFPFLQEALSLPEDAERFWEAHFRGYSPLGLFTESPKIQNSQATHEDTLQIPYNEAKDRLRTLGVSLLSVCQAAWADVLAVCSNSTDICFGLVMNGRSLDIEGLDRLVAPCFNTIPVRQDVSTFSGSIDLAKSFQRLNADFQRFQFSPLRSIQKLVTKDGLGLFDTLLLLQNPSQDMDAALWSLEEDYGEMDIPVVCEIIPRPNLNSLDVNMHYDRNAVSADLALAFTDIFKLFFRTILDHPSSALPSRNDIQPYLSALNEMKIRRSIRMGPAEDYQSDAEWTELEIKIRQVLSSLSSTPIQKIHHRTSIFQLGLDSINAVQVASLLRKEGLTVSASDVIECQNCARLADRIAEGFDGERIMRGYDFDKFSKEVSAQLAHKLSDAALEAVLPSTPLQCAMLASFVQSQGQNYLNLLSYEVDNSYSKDDLIRAWKPLRDQHPMLRTGFAAIQSPHSSFAMLRYPSESEVLNSAIVVFDMIPKDDLIRWKAEQSAIILNNLNLPPWRVGLAETDGRLTMNILIHHALYDAHSLDQMLDLLSELLVGSTVNPIQFIEPALAGILSKSINHQSAAQDFWQSKAEATVVNTFPVMTPLREEKRDMISHEIKFTMALSDLQMAAKQQNASVQAIIQAAWTRILSSYLGEDSVVFGVTLSGRSLDETGDAPFPCMNTIPVIASNLPSNAQLVHLMMEYNTDAYRHQYSPLSQIQKWLGNPARPVFDTILVYQKLDKEPSNTRPWKLVDDHATVDYPVSLEVKPMSNDEVRLCITFFSDILPEEQADLLVRQFDAMMIHIATEPEGDEDGIYRSKPQLFAITPAVSPELPAPVRFLHHFVEERAVSHPHDTALEFVKGFDGSRPVKQVWSYTEFNEMGNRVANLLSGIASVGSIVAIHFEKCPEAYFSILGILKAGCAFVALDPSAPKDRKEFILRDSMAPCLLKASGSEIDFDTDAKIINIDVESIQKLSAEQRELGPQFTPDATCYCLYTSGTTGTPKGCEITHDNSVQAMMAFQELFKGHWSDDSRWLQFAALHFDVSVLEQYWSWSVGITVVAAPRDVILDDLIASINNLDITHIDLTPSLARLTHPDEVPGLCKGVFITGGEQLKQEILDVWGPKSVIYNAYGPTEATIGVTMYQRVPINGRPSNIGKQFLNVGSYVFRKGTEIPVLRGAVGELCVSGRLVGKGYLNREELTEERFPTLSEFGERIYRTGDLVRVLHDGCFDFLGRADDQVKLRGQRLEIGEITHVIRTGVSEVKDAATIVIRYASSGKDVLVSFLVGEQQQPKTILAPLTDDDHLGMKAKAACRAKLPGYMIPTYFLILPFIPLSPNNKVEAKELKKLFNSLSHEQLMDLAASKTSFQSIDGEGSQQVIKIISSFTGMDSDKIDGDTSIFDLGVDSISALQLSAAFKNDGFEACSPATLLQNPVVADLITALYEKKFISQRDNRMKESQQLIQAYHHRYRAFICGVLGISGDDVEYIAPCSALQQGIISKSIADEVRGTYFNSFVFHLSNAIVDEQLKTAWSQLIASQAILRTAFIKTTEGYVQAALKAPNLRWTEETVKHDEKIVLDSHWEEWVQRNSEHVITPVEALLVKGPGFKKLIVHIFHAIYDGSSFELMLRQLQAFYAGKSTTSSAPSFIEALSHGPLWRHDDCREFWQNHLLGWDDSTLQLSSAHADAISRIQVIDGAALENLRKKHKVTLQPVIMALWTSVLQKHSRGGLTTGVIVSGRSIDLAGIENTIGPLFNTLPFFNKALSGQTWASLIHKCSVFSTTVLPFQHVPLKSIQKWCSGGRQLFDNLFVFEVEQQQAAVDELELWTIEDGPLNPDYPLALEAKKLLNDDIQLTLVAQGHVADASMLQEMLDQVEENLALMSADAPLVQPVENGVTVSAKQNGFTHSNTKAHEQQLEWTGQALQIRDEVASLSGIDALEISMASTILELGLDSIDVIQLSARLKQRGIQLSASSIMRQQNIAKMVSCIEVQQSSELPQWLSDERFHGIEQKLWNYARNAGLNVDEIEAVLPPTPLQESMAAGMIHSDFEWYFNHDLLEIGTGVDVERLQKAFVQVISQSPILRTGFLEVDDLQLDMGYCQVVHKRWSNEIEHIEVEDITKVKNLIDNAKQTSKAKNGTNALFQLKFVSCHEQTFVLISIAHALYDGWSLSLLYRDLEMAFYGTLQTRMSAKPFLQKVLASGTEDGDRFWAGYLDGVTPSALPELREDGVDEKLYRMEYSSKMPASDILSFCKKQGISLQVLCQACWALVLAHRVKALDVTFGLVMSGRDFEGAEDLMFPTINTVPLRCILYGSSVSFLRYLEANMADIRTHQAYPLRKIQNATHLSGSDLFNTLFMLQKSPYSLSEEPLLSSVDGASAVDYPVSVEAEIVEDVLVWRTACQSRYISESGVGKLLQDLNTVLEFLTSPDEPEILSFQDNGVSIGGLPHISISATADIVQNGNGVKKSEATDDEHGQLDETYFAIRKTLSYVSDIPQDAVRPESNLYHLGLDSISAIKVSSLLRKEGIHINPRDLIRATDINQMCRLATTVLTNGDRPKPKELTWTPTEDVDIKALLADAHISQEDVKAVLPALPMQVYMISAWQNAEGSVFYPEFRYIVKGAVSEEEVLLAWRRLVAQTPILRTVFFATDSDQQPFLQVILKASYEPADDFAAAKSMVQLHVSHLGGEIAIRLKIHHALYDGVSIQEILHRLSNFIGGRMIEQENGIAEWSRYAIQPTVEDSRQSRRAFWTAYMNGCSTDGDDIAPVKAGKQRVSYLQQSAVSDMTRLLTAAKESGISLQALFFAAYAKTLALESGGDVGDRNKQSIVFGIYLANRSDEALSPIYPTLNLVPLRVEVARGDTLLQVASSIQDDIHLVSAEGRANVGLWEVAVWTGVRVTSFVNFLSLPGGSQESVDVELVPLQREEDVLGPLVNGSKEEAVSHPCISNNPVRDAFPAAIDIEASIHGKSLDIGVFGSQKRLSDEGAISLVASIVSHLELEQLDDGDTEMAAWASAWEIRSIR